MDYGFRKKRRLSRSMMIALGVGALVCLAIVGYFTTASLLRDREKNISDAEQYDAKGDPCPATTKADLAVNGPNLRHDFDFGGMHLRHAFGDADCAWIVDHGGAGMGRFPVCRFTSPGSLEVVIGKTDVFFRPPLGKPAAIVLDRGQVRCLLTAKEMG
jgi:hypothetical protein